MPINVESTIEGEAEELHFCAVQCLLAYRVSTYGVVSSDRPGGFGGYQTLAVSFEGRSAVDAIKAMGGKVSE